MNPTSAPSYLVKSTLYKPVYIQSVLSVHLILSGYFVKVLLKLFNGHISEFTVKQDNFTKDLK